MIEEAQQWPESIPSCASPKRHHLKFETKFDLWCTFVTVLFREYEVVCNTSYFVFKKKGNEKLPFVYCKVVFLGVEQ